MAPSQPSEPAETAPAETAPAGSAPAHTAPAETARTIWSGVLTGIGFAAFVDETVFHQLLHWHHFYDKSTTTVGLVSDGFFHAGGFICIVVGLFLRADAVRRRGLVPKRWWAALLLGAGGFQLYDGTIQHKLLKLHQIRYSVSIWPYDLTWNLLAAVMIVVGIVLMTGRARVAHTDRSSDRRLN